MYVFFRNLRKKKHVEEKWWGHNLIFCWLPLTRSLQRIQDFGVDDDDGDGGGGVGGVADVVGDPVILRGGFVCGDGGWWLSWCP